MMRLCRYALGMLDSTFYPGHGLTVTAVTATVQAAESSSTDFSRPCHSTHHMMKLCTLVTA
jgi:hypothetical protein